MTDDPADELRRLREQVEALERRVAAIEAETGVEPGAGDDASEDRTAVESGPPAADAAAAEGTAADAAADDAAAADAADAEPTTDAADTAAADAATNDVAADAPDTAHDATDGDWERSLGSKWLPLAGGAALVIGVVFFVQIAIERGLLGPLGRVAAGTLGGLALFALGRYVAESQGYDRWGRIAAGAGLAISYFSVYAAYGFESYRTALGTPLWAVLVGQTLLVGAAVALSVRDRAPAVAGQAFLLGYGTAFLALDAGSFLLTPAYALLLTVGLVATTTVRPWRLHLVASVLPTYALLAVWVADLEPSPVARVAVGVAVVLCYAAGAYLLSTERREDGLARFDIAALTVLDGVAGAAFLETAVRALSPDAPVEGLAVGAVALALLGRYAATERRTVRRNDAAGALGVVLAGASVVLAAEPFAATVGLLAVVVAAVAVAERFDASAVRSGGHLVAAATAYKLMVVDAFRLAGFDAGDPVATLTGRPAAFALAIATFYGLARRWAATDERVRAGLGPETPLAAPYAAVGTGLTVVLLGLELSGVGISVAWALFGLALVAGGLSLDRRGLRLQGVAVLLLATLKVFVFDTSGLDLLARTVSFLVLGAILLLASYGYTRWQGGEDALEQFSGE